MSKCSVRKLPALSVQPPQGKMSLIVELTENQLSDRATIVHICPVPSALNQPQSYSNMWLIIDNIIEFTLAMDWIFSKWRQESTCAIAVPVSLPTPFTSTSFICPAPMPLVQVEVGAVGVQLSRWGHAGTHIRLLHPQVESGMQKRLMCERHRKDSASWLMQRKGTWVAYCMLPLAYWSIWGRAKGWKERGLSCPEYLCGTLACTRREGCLQWCTHPCSPIHVPLPVHAWMRHCLLLTLFAQAGRGRRGSSGRPYAHCPVWLSRDKGGRLTFCTLPTFPICAQRWGGTSPMCERERKQVPPLSVHGEEGGTVHTDGGHVTRWGRGCKLCVSQTSWVFHSMVWHKHAKGAAPVNTKKSFGFFQSFLVSMVVRNQNTLKT